MSHEFTSPQDCHSMRELRQAIDALDAHLVALFALRQRYIERAAVLKTDRNRVHDDARIEEVVAKVVAEGTRLGLSSQIAEKVWRTLIAASIDHEYAAFDEKNAGPSLS